jgi:hypothetical protein
LLKGKRKPKPYCREINKGRGSLWMRKKKNIMMKGRRRKKTRNNRN